MKLKPNLKITLSGLLLILIAARVLLPAYLLKKSNQYLASFSEDYIFHIDDLDLSIIRGAYRFEKLNGKIRKNDKQILSVKEIDVSLAWRELIKGRLLTDIKASELHLSLLREMKNYKLSKDEAKNAKETLFPVKVEKVELKNSEANLEELPSLSEDKRFRLTDIGGIITNLTPTYENPLSQFNLSASILNSRPILISGELKIMNKPLAWHFTAELEKFELTKLNPYLWRNVPLTFTKGQVDIFMEAKSEEGKINGYMKPFFIDLDVIAKKEKFKGIKHWGIEILTALTNLILRESKHKTLATVFYFEQGPGGFKVNQKKALGKALENSFGKPLHHGLDHKYQLN